MAEQQTDEYERMKQAIQRGAQKGSPPVSSVAAMRPPCRNAGVLLCRWLDEQRELRG
jgi:hypothetical protein